MLYYFFLLFFFYLFCVWLCSMDVLGAGGGQKTLGPYWAGVADGCELACGSWELDPDPRQY